MARQRPSRPARGPSSMSSSSGAILHTAHESRRSMYPDMQARVSDAEDSEPSNRPRRTDSPFLPPPRGSTRSHESVSGSGHSSRSGRSRHSQSSRSGFSEAPEDSISSRGASPPNRDCHPHPHGRDPDMHWSPESAWYRNSRGPYVRIKAKNAVGVMC